MKILKIKLINKYILSNYVGYLHLTVPTHNIKYIKSITIVFFLQLCQLTLFHPKYNKMTTFIAVFDF